MVFPPGGTPAPARWDLAGPGRPLAAPTQGDGAPGRRAPQSKAPRPTQGTAALCPERGTSRRPQDRNHRLSLFLGVMAVTAGSGPKTVRKDAGRRVLPQTNRRPAPFFFGVKARFFFRRKRNGPCPCRAGTPRRDSGPARWDLVRPGRPLAAPTQGDGAPSRRAPQSKASRPTDGHSARRVWEAAPRKPKRRALQTEPPPPQNQSPACHKPGPPGEKQLQLVIYQKKITFRIQKTQKKGRPAGRPFRLCQEAQPLGSSFPSGSSRTLAEAHSPARA